MEKWRFLFKNSLYLNFCSFIDLIFLIFLGGLEISKDSKIVLSSSQIVEAFENNPFLFILVHVFQKYNFGLKFQKRVILSYFHLFITQSKLDIINCRKQK